MTRLLITGVGGFIGAHLLDHVLAVTDWEVVGLDSFRHRGLCDRITESHLYQSQRERVTIVTHDLAAPLSPGEMDRLGAVDYIVNLAAESHVDRSITDPVPFVTNNVAVALHMLEYARSVKPRVFIQISTDEVYGPVAPGGQHQEWETILPSNPYSASKAAQEALAIAYWRTYDVPVVLTNTMNNFGERQDAEKYVPKALRAMLLGESVPIHGTPHEIGSRYWLHARNHADALLWLLRLPPARRPYAARPDRYNIVGEACVDNLRIARLLAEIADLPLQWHFVDPHINRPGHDAHYGLDGGKLAATGWRAPYDFQDSLERTVRWTLEHPHWLGLPAAAVMVN